MPELENQYVKYGKIGYDHDGMNDAISECRNDLLEVEEYIMKLEAENRTLLRKRGIKSKHMSVVDRVWIGPDTRNAILKRANKYGEVALEAQMLHPILIKVIGIENIE